MEEEKKKYPWNKSRAEDAPPAASGVYAGPEFYNQQPPESQLTMCVYAGPEYFAPNNGAGPPPGAFVAFDSLISSVYCPECGMAVGETDRFCTNCGAKLPEKQGDD